MKQIKIILLFLFAINIGFAQNQDGDKNYENLAYAYAVDKYLEAVRNGTATDETYRKLGDSFYYNGKLFQACKWYAEYFEMVGETADAEYMFKYAQTLKAREKYEEANKWMDKFYASKNQDKRARLAKRQSSYLDDIELQSNRYKVDTLMINSSQSDFAAAFGDRGIVFSSARDTGSYKKTKHSWTKMPFLQLYSAYATKTGELFDVQKLNGDINKKFHESTVAITKDGSTMYFTRNNFLDGKKRKSSNDIIKLKLYRATWNGEEWIDIIELPFNSDEYSVAHPALSVDESKLYFASDMKGSRGQSDLFYVDISERTTNDIAIDTSVVDLMTALNEKYSYGEPVNLGDKINTEGRETFPFISKNGDLYFASEGHPGLGGLDVFVSDINGNNIINVGKPVNSPQDDFGFIINDETKIGYFTSNRFGGKGSDDIYKVKELQPIVTECIGDIKGIVVDRMTKDIIPNAVVTLYGQFSNKLYEISANDKGEFKFDNIDCFGLEYTVTAYKKGYSKDSETFKLSVAERNTDVQLELEEGTNLELFKSSKATGKKVGDIVEYNFTVQNNGKKIISNLFINDARIGVQDLSVNPSTLQPGETGYAIAKYTITRADINLGKIFNIASVYGITLKGDKVTDDSDSLNPEDELGTDEDPTVTDLTFNIGDDLATILNLKPIYFDLDKHFIRPDAEIELKKVIDFMNSYPTVQIDVRSHTDSRGSDKYNLALSKRRNNSTKEYIINKGLIDSMRVTGSGFGESQPVNQCTNGVKCSDDEHQLNRRSEFIVITK